MRMKLLRRSDGAMVRLLFPDVYEEYASVFDVLGRPVRRFGARRNSGPPSVPAARPVAPPVYIVTTAAQRARWLLGDLAAGAETLVVDERRAVDLLLDRASDPAAAYRPFSPGDGDFISRGGHAGYLAGYEAVEAVRRLEATDAVVDDVLDKLARSGLPPAVAAPFSASVRDVLRYQGAAVSGLAEQLRLVAGLRRRAAAPQRFDRGRVEEVLAASHAGLEVVKARILDSLAVCPQARDLLTVESFRSGKDIDRDPRTALVVRPAPVRDPDPVLCLAGSAGTGKTSLARAVARALHRPFLTESLDVGGPSGAGALNAHLRGAAVIAPGRLAWGILECGVTNPVFVPRGGRQGPRRRGRGPFSTCSTPPGGPGSATTSSTFRSTSRRSCGSQPRSIRRRFPRSCGSTWRSSSWPATARTRSSSSRRITFCSARSSGPRARRRSSSRPARRRGPPRAARPPGRPADGTSPRTGGCRPWRRCRPFWRSPRSRTPAAAPTATPRAGGPRRCAAGCASSRTPSAG